MEKTVVACHADLAEPDAARYIAPIETWHHVEPYANNLIDADHSQLKHRLSAQVSPKICAYRSK